MDEFDVSETILARGWSDTKRAMHTFLFWFLEAGGGTVMGALFDPIWVLVWFFGGFAMLWIGATAGAPFKQRSEARSRVLALEGHQPEFLDIEEAGRLYRDCLVKFEMSEGVKMFDRMVAGQTGGVGSVASAFRWTLVEAVNEGAIEVWGVPQNGSQEERISHVEDLADAWSLFRGGDPSFLMSNGVYYRNLRIKRDDIEKYAIQVRDHDAELERRMKEKNLSEPTR